MIGKGFLLLPFIFANNNYTLRSRGDFLSPLTPPYVPFGIRRFNITSKHVVPYNNRSN